MLKHSKRVFWRGCKMFIDLCSVDGDGIIESQCKIWKYDPRILIRKFNQWVIPKPYKRKAIRRGRHWNRSRMR
jgi:hypothetical protein